MDRERVKKLKISYNTFDKKINLTYFIPFAQWENEFDFIRLNLWDLWNDGRKLKKEIIKEKQGKNNK